MLSQNGVLQRWTWQPQGWLLFLATPIDKCDTYALCGAYGTCNTGDSPECRCLNKFARKHSDDWATTNWSNGCVRKIASDCYNGGSDGFLKYSDVKLPDTRNSWYNVSMTLEECQKACSSNCSCMAYANLDIRNGGSGCLLWFGELIDIRDFPEGAGQDIYVRMASSDSEIGTKNFGGSKSSSNRKKGIAMKVSLPLSAGVLLLGVILTVYLRKRKKNKLLLKREGYDSQQDDTNERQDENVELPIFSLSEISNCTNNFSIDNKLGEGGFGPVYKAWRLHQEGRSQELVDPTVELGKSLYLLEAMRLIQLGLLCVQKYPEDRPSMSSVVLMLGSDGGLPSPKQPGFFTERSTVVEKSKSQAMDSNNECTVTLLDAR
ncbi:hypothetical protein RJ639_029900 [Escallonia herrerae]|uniref:Apple domain-containing protein n=1 Tax=Escallonia herrerae TaxID=1293975 RepID=A0AA89BD07_9ASTE|nr:hypothetical protein RJ639_029900 [Escallonia herrerae]